MKLITRDTDYAIRSILAIAGHEGVVAATELEKEIKVPRPFLRKILQSLQKRGILRSYKGKRGGFTIKRDLSKIRLTDMVRIFQGPIKLNECIFKKHICPNRSKCPIRRKIIAIERHVIRELNSITLESFLRK